MFKKTIALLAGLAIALTAYAATTHLKPGHPDHYVVKKGDTLWDLSARFLVKPWYWPEIWQANPQVHNPHLIYPGDVLNLAYDHGPVIRLEPSVHVGKTPIPTIPLADVKAFLENVRVVSPDALEAAPYVLAFEENHLNGIPGQFVYARQTDAKRGQQFAIVRPEHAFRQISGSDGVRVAHDVDSAPNLAPGTWLREPFDNDPLAQDAPGAPPMQYRPWDEDFRHDGHYAQGKMLGIGVRVIGKAEVLQAGDPATLLITSSKREIQEGDRLLPVNAHPYDPYFYPHAPKTIPSDARVIALHGTYVAAGKDDVVALSVGTADGINNGTTFGVYKPGMRVRDDVADHALHTGLRQKVKLPDEYVANVMVFQAFKHVSYALIMDGIRPVNVMDKLKMPQ